VWPAAQGGHLSRTNFMDRVLDPAKARVGLDRLTFHDLRHSHVAHLIARGTDPLVIKERLGHSSIQVTYDLYGYVFDRVGKTVADDLDADQRAVLARRDGSNVVAFDRGH
jgi:integrase